MTILSLKDLSHLPSLPEGCVAALGFFDGVHTGHSEILRSAVRTAEATGKSPAVWMISQKNSAFKGSPSLLTDEAEKLRLLGEAGIRYAVISDFHEIRDLDGESFVRDVLAERLRLSGVTCGFNFRFGKGASCSIDDLERYCAALGLSCSVTPSVTCGGLAVSSSRIRTLISEGKPEEAAALLGRPYSFALPVVRGKMLGRSLGFPTVNQLVPKSLACFPAGVYAVSVTITENGAECSYPGAANIGVCPTVTDEILYDAGLTSEGKIGAAGKDHPVCETYIVGFSGDLYGKSVQISFLSRIRGEVKFDGIDALTRQIALDAARAEEIFESYGK